MACQIRPSKCLVDQAATIADTIEAGTNLQRTIIPLSQARLYVVSAARGTGRLVCEDCLA
jgi:hypothetical protein